MAAGTPAGARAILASLAAAILGGCMVGPDYVQPGAAVNESWLDEAATAREDAPIERAWWETFEDPTLTALIETAFHQNLSLRAAGLRVIEARARRSIAVGEFFPQLQQAFGVVGANQLSANSIDSGGDRSFSEASIGLEAVWELDFWGQFRRNIEAADAELLFTVADFDAVLTSLEADVATNYILLRSIQERIDIAHANVSLQQETLRLTEARFNAGAVSELDVSTARSTLANTQAQIPDLENSLLETKLALCILLGRPPSELEEELLPQDSAAPRVPEAPARIAAGIPADLLRRRPDVRAAERIAAAQSARIGVATAELYPAISLVGSTAFVSTNFEGVSTPDLGNIFDADSFTGFIGLQLDWPILNYGRIIGNVRVQDALFEQAVAAYQDSVLRAAADVESGLSVFLRAREQAEYLAEGVDAAQRSVELSLIQYRAGAVDFIRVNDAQTTLVQQEDSLVVARAAIALGAVRAYRALGGGWEIREGAEFIDAETAQRMRERTNWGDVLAPDWDRGNDLGFARPAEVESVAQPLE